MNLRYHLSKKKKDTQRWPRLLPVLKQAARLELDRPWTFCDEVLHVKVFRGGTKWGKINTVNEHREHSTIADGQHFA